MVTTHKIRKQEQKLFFLYTQNGIDRERQMYPFSYVGSSKTLLPPL